jgi:TonB-dependent SusC/RagA subfamily outer membrane receptor
LGQVLALLHGLSIPCTNQLPNTVKKPYLIIGLCLLCLGFARAQSTAPDSLTDRIQKYSRLYSAEKVHLHFDKPLYALGDTIWFESYVVKAANNIPSDRSRILHVELIDAKNKLCKALQLTLNLGFASGDFVLPDSLDAGTYRIRAYTNWMRNLDAAYFFSKNITVVDPFPKSGQQVAAAKQAAVTNNSTQGDIASASVSNYDMQFFPEGGQLVNGLRSAVAFKALASTGLGVPVSGKLVDELNNPVIDFKSAYAGMGAFSFTPALGKTYTAVVKMPDGSEKRIALPLALTSGYVITADNSSADSLCITLQCTADLVNKGNLTFMPLSNGVPLFFMKTQFPDKQINITAPKNKLPGGIIQLTLLNNNNQPLAERLVFNNYRQQANINIGQLNTSYQKRGKTTFDLQATDATGKPLIGSFSVAVTNADAVNPNETGETTILSNLLLTSDLKGYIENPNYYFTATSAQKNRELDNLMLTQGWSRMVWKAASTEQSADIIYKAEDKLTLSGNIDGGPKISNKNIPMTLLVGQLGNGALLDTLTNADGDFTFNIPDSLRDLPMRLQAKPKRAYMEYRITLDGYLPATLTMNNTPNTWDVGVADTVSRSAPGANTYSKAAAANLRSNPNVSFLKNTVHLKEVKIKEKDYDPTHKLRGTNTHSNNLNGPGQADKVLLPEDIENMPDLSTIDVLLPGTGMMVGPLGATLFLRGNVGPHMPGIMVLIDGAEASKNLKEISPRDIESIEFMKTPGYTGVYGIRGSGGVLLITTKRGGPDNTKTGPSMFAKATRLKEVKVKDYNPRPKLVNSHSANLNGPGQADKVLLPEDIEKMPDLSTIDVLLNGTVVTPERYLRQRSNTGTHLPPVMILIDGVDAGPKAFLDVSPRDIESIEFMKTPAYAGIYGIRGAGGVLVITTKKGGPDNSYITGTAPNSLSLKLPLYTKREFYSPVYDKPLAANIPDQRTTVYWKPDVITDKDGKARVQFYNTDVPGNYRVVIEGISAKGNLCRQVYNYKVE